MLIIDNWSVLTLHRLRKNEAQFWCLRRGVAMDVVGDCYDEIQRRYF